MTAVMRLADARLAASTICSCSKMASLIDIVPLAPWLWMMKTSIPRIDSLKRQCISPLANSEQLASPSSTSRHAAISSASGRFARPETMCSFFLVTSSMTTLRLPARELRLTPLAGSRSVERPRSPTGNDLRTRVEHGVGTDHRIVADRGVASDALGDLGPLAHPGVDQPGMRADLAAGPHRRRTLEHGAGEQGDIRGQGHARVDVGGGRIDDADAGLHPADVGAAAQLGLDHRQLRPVVDALRLLGVVGDQRHDLVPGVGQYLDHVGDVEL